MEIVKHHNDINKIRLGTLTEKELDIFISLLFTMQEEGTREVILSFSELKQLTEAKVRNNDRLIKSIDSMSSKLIKLNQRIEVNGVISHINLFEVLSIDTNTSMLKIKITETFSHMLNGLTKDFTYYSLKEYINLSSGYSKLCYKLLRQYRGNNWYMVELEEFKNLLCVPNTYKAKHLNEKVLLPIKKELTPLFRNLKITKLTKDKRIVGRGMKSHYIKFEWDNDLKAKSTLQDNIKNKNDKIQAEATERANKSHLEVEKATENKKVLSDLDIAKNKLCLKLVKQGKLKEVGIVTEIDTLEELKKFEI